MRGGSARFYHPDIIGTTRTTSNASAAVSSTLETDAFGNTWTPGTSGSQSPFGYAGQHGYQSDADSGLMRVGYRYYDALSGRFISRDPVQDGYNWYAYCNNDPVNFVDPYGLFYISIGGSATGAIGVIGGWVSAEINIGDGGIGVSVHVGSGTGYSHNVEPFMPSVSVGPVIGFNRGDVPNGPIKPEIVSTGYVSAGKGAGLTLSSPADDSGFPSVAVSGQFGPTIGTSVLVGLQTGAGAAVPWPWNAPPDMWGNRY